MAVFKDYARYYDALYRNKDYMKEARDIDRLLRRQAGAQGIVTLLNLGCGTGKHDRCLNALGYAVDGVDMSAEMIQEARVAGSGNDYEVADIRTYAPQKKYDAVISMFHVISYQNTNEDVVNAFGTARRALDAGGLFLFDLWYGPGVLTDKPATRIKQVETDRGETVVRLATATMHPETDIVDVHYDMLILRDGKYSTIHEDHHMRYFFRPEIEFYLNQTGFELLECLDCNSLERTDFNSWTAYFIARAK